MAHNQIFSRENVINGNQKHVSCVFELLNADHLLPKINRPTFFKHLNLLRAQIPEPVCPLFQDLKEECVKLRTRVFDLEQQNRILSLLFQQRVKMTSTPVSQVATHPACLHALVQCSRGRCTVALIRLFNAQENVGSVSL